MSDLEKIRLNKFISDTGFCSRREADRVIEDGRVHVNGSIAVLGTRVDENDEVLVDGKTIRSKEKPIYIALNKPVGIICTTDRKVKHNITDFVNYPKRIFPIGRLDRPSEGLIFLTNDGNIVNKILRAGNNHEKEYLVSVHKPITDEFMKKMSGGVPILCTITRRCVVKQTGACEFSIVLTQGLNRQIRRMCEYLEYEVTRLKRVRIMNVTLSGLEPGKWRHLSAVELDAINKSVAQSMKTDQGSRWLAEDEMD